MKSKNSKPAAKFRVGDRVQFEFGGDKIWGTITEDRGIIGANGRRWYTISVPMDPYELEPHVREEEKLEPDTMSRVPLKKSEIIGFLKDSGLLRILISNPSTEREDPQVWLCRDQGGGVTYTFSPKRGTVGGQLVPYFAHWEGNRIDARSKDEVAAFLASFGLTPQEAEDVIRAVGTTAVKKPRRPMPSC